MSIADYTEKKFVMKHFFKDVKNQIIDGGHGAEMSGPVEEHFGVEWKLSICNHDNERVDFNLNCLHSDESSDWKIWADFEVYVNGSSISDEMYLFENIRQSNSGWIEIGYYDNYCTNDSMPVEIRVIIREMTGIKKEKLRHFDDDLAKEHSDVVLKIEDQEFHVNKMYLSFQSPYFKSLFSGNFVEFQKSEIDLKDIDAQDFQNLLELLHGEPSVDDNTVDGILELADMYDTETAIRQCEKFLLNESEKSKKEKLTLAIQYNMEKLKTKCISEINTVADLRSIVPEDPSDFDDVVWKELYIKLLAFSQ